MILAVGLFVMFTILSTAGLYWILHYHYGWKVATLWSVLLLAGFVALGWYLWWILSTLATDL